MQTVLAGAVCLGLLSTGAAAAENPAPVPEVLTIYSTGGLRGQFFAQDPVSGLDTEYNYLKVASAMAELRERTAASLLLDSGDALCGGLVSSWDLTGVDDPAQMVLEAIGYDALVPGFGEFLAPMAYREQLFPPPAEDGEEEQAEAPAAETTAAEPTAAEEPEETRAPMALLSGNLLNAETGEPVLEPYHIFTVELAEQSWQIGVVGFGCLEEAEYLPENRRENLVFAHKDNEAHTYAWEWEQHLAPALEEAACDLTVVVCDAADLSAFVAATRGIDLVLTHAGEPGTWTVLNADGEEIPCLSTGGSTLSQTLVGVGEDGALCVEEYGLLDLSDYPNDPELTAAVAEAANTLSRQAVEKKGTLAGGWDNNEKAPYQQTDTFDLTGRAMCWAAGADGALLAPASLGAQSLAALFPKDARTAPLSLRDCYAVAPRPWDTLCLVELTGAQLRGWLDVCAGRYSVDEHGYLTGGETADALYGLSYELYVGDLPGRRVVGLTWKGKPVEDTQTFRIAVERSRLDDPDFPQVPVLWSASADPRFAAQGGSVPAVLAGYADNLALLAPLREDTWSIYTGSKSGPMNRLEFVTLLYELAGRPEPAVDTAFVDLSGDPAAVWAAECGIVSGDGQGRFLPTQAVTREQGAVILTRFAQNRGVNTTGTGGAANLLDYIQVAQWAQPAVDFCYSSGIMPANGFHGRLFRPQDTFTRSEAEEFLNALQRLLESKGVS